MEVHTIGLQLRALLNQEQISQWLLQQLAQPWTSLVCLILEYVSLCWNTFPSNTNPSAGDSSDAQKLSCKHCICHTCLFVEARVGSHLLFSGSLCSWPVVCPWSAFPTTEEEQFNSSRHRHLLQSVSPPCFDHKTIYPIFPSSLHQMCRFFAAASLAIYCWWYDGHWCSCWAEVAVGQGVMIQQAGFPQHLTHSSTPEARLQKAHFCFMPC